MLRALYAGISGLGRQTVDGVWRIGYATRFFVAILLHSGTALSRFGLTIREIYFSGVLSLIIILVSGLFVGMVLGLQGYETLQTYGSEEALGILVALSLVRELGPVVAALLFASRAGSAITAEIGLMKATEQLTAMEMMAVDPIARVVAPRFWAGRDFHAFAGGYVFRDGNFRRLSGGSGVDRRGSGELLVADAGGGGFPPGYYEWNHQESGVWRGSDGHRPL